MTPLTAESLRKFAADHKATEDGIAADSDTLSSIAARLTEPVLDGIRADQTAMQVMGAQLMDAPGAGVKQDRNRLNRIRKKLIEQPYTQLQQDRTVLTGIAARAQHSRFPGATVQPSNPGGNPYPPKVVQGKQGQGSGYPASPTGAGGMALPGVTQNPTAIGVGPVLAVAANTPLPNLAASGGRLYLAASAPGGTAGSAGASGPWYAPAGWASAESPYGPNDPASAQWYSTALAPTVSPLPPPPPPTVIPVYGSVPPPSETVAAQTPPPAMPPKPPSAPPPPPPPPVQLLPPPPPPPPPDTVSDEMAWVVQTICACLSSLATATGKETPVDISEPAAYLFGERSDDWHRAASAFLPEMYAHPLAYSTAAEYFAAGTGKPARWRRNDPDAIR